MELKLIRYFVKVAEELNFSRAAEKLHIAQPHLSRQIKVLEENIGTKLFNRSRRHVELTHAGKFFLKKAYPLIEQVEQISVSTRLSALGKEGELQIAFNGAVQDIIPTLKSYHEHFPEVGIMLRQMNTDEQLKALNQKRIDLAVLSIPVYDANIKLFPLKSVPFLAALPKEHPLTKKERLFIHDFSEEPFIITPKSAGPMYYNAIMSIFKQTNFTPNITIQAHDLQTVMALVAANMGMSLTPSPMKSTNEITLKKVEDIDISLEASLAWKIDNKSETLKNFLLFFEEYYETDFLK